MSLVSGILPLAGPRGARGVDGVDGLGVISASETYLCQSVHPTSGIAATQYQGTLGNLDTYAVEFRSGHTDRWSFPPPNLANYIDGPVRMVVWCVPRNTSRHDFTLEFAKAAVGDDFAEPSTFDFNIQSASPAGRLLNPAFTLPAGALSIRQTDELIFNYALRRKGGTDPSPDSIDVFRIDFYYQGLWLVPAP